MSCIKQARLRWHYLSQTANRCPGSREETAPRGLTGTDYPTRWRGCCGSQATMLLHHLPHSGDWVSGRSVRAQGAFFSAGSSHSHIQHQQETFPSRCPRSGVGGPGIASPEPGRPTQDGHISRRESLWARNAGWQPEAERAGRRCFVQRSGVRYVGKITAGVVQGA